MNAASQITSRLLRNIKSGNITRGSAVLAGIASRRTVPFGALVLCNRDAAVAEMLPTAVIRSSVPCCSSSADLDVVELQLKVFDLMQFPKRSHSAVCSPTEVMHGATFSFLCRWTVWCVMDAPVAC